MLSLCQVFNKPEIRQRVSLMNKQQTQWYRRPSACRAKGCSDTMSKFRKKKKDLSFQNLSPAWVLPICPGVYSLYLWESFQYYESIIKTAYLFWQWHHHHHPHHHHHHHHHRHRSHLQSVYYVQDALHRLSHLVPTTIIWGKYSYAYLKLRKLKLKKVT